MRQSQRHTARAGINHSKLKKEEAQLDFSFEELDHSVWLVD